MAKRSDITEEVQVFIVQSLACYNSPSQVVRLVKEEFNVNLKRQNVRHYHPYQSKDAAEKWKDIFDSTRADFIAKTNEIGAYHLSYRLASLERLYERAEAAGNIVLAANLLKQMAEEVGGVYTNKREVSGAGGGPQEHVHLSLEEWKAGQEQRREQAEATAAQFAEDE